MDNLYLGLKVAGIGIGGVFGVLLALWGIILLVKKAIAVLENRNSKATATTAPATASPAPVAVVSTDDEDEIIAVITAVISQMMAEEYCGSSELPEFRIASVKEIKRHQKRRV